MLTPTPIPIPHRPKPGPIGTWEELAQHQLRLQLMVFMLCKSMSYRAIARELGVARTTVMRMAPEAAGFSAYTNCFVNIPLPTTRFETNKSPDRRREQEFIDCRPSRSPV